MVSRRSDVSAQDLAGALCGALMAEVEERVRTIVRAEMEQLRKAGEHERSVAATQWLTTDAAAELAGVQPETIRDWIASRKLARHTAGRLLRVRRDELVALLEGGEQEPRVTDGAERIRMQRALERLK